MAPRRRRAGRLRKLTRADRRRRAAHHARTSRVPEPRITPGARSMHRHHGATATVELEPGAPFAGERVPALIPRRLRRRLARHAPTADVAPLARALERGRITP